MKICEKCFSRMWPGIVFQTVPKDTVLHIQKREIIKGVAGVCDYCAHERRLVFEIWYEV